MSKVNIPLTSKYVGQTVIHLDKVGSTNGYLSGGGYEGPFTEGLVVCADYQTSGIGRKQRVWFASKGDSLLFSLLLRPNQDVGELHEITQIMALSISIAIEQLTKINTSIKWPNDIYIGDRKCGGVLSELKIDKEVFYKPIVIVGVGLNVNETKGGFPKDIRKRASSLLIETGIKWDRFRMLGNILSCFEDYYELWKKQGFNSIIDELSLRFYLKDKNVKVVVSDKSTIYGKVLGMDKQGYLIVKEDRGIVHCIVSGDIVIL